MEMLYSKADLHLHTTASDGSATVRQLLAHVANSDLQVIAITDHDTLAGALEARRLAKDFGVEVIVGEEVSTREGHLLVLFLEHELPPGRPLVETVAAARAQNALVIAPHPFDFLMHSVGRTRILGPCASSAWADHVDAIETFNAGMWLPQANTQAARFAAARGLPAVGGSDSHHLPTVGRGYTIFPGRTADDLRRAILHGETRAAGERWGILRVAEASMLYLQQSLNGHLATAERG